MPVKLRSLTLAVTSRCNLNCTYCYHDCSTVGKDMGGETLDQAMKLANQDPPCHIQITGGEPTLVPEAIERIAWHANRMKKRPKLAIQTNGTLLSSDQIKLFQTHNLQVGVSVDGPPDLHEQVRGSATATLRGLALLEAMGVDFGITAVVTRFNVLHLDKLALLLANFHRARGIGLDLVIGKGRAGVSPPLSPSPQDLHHGVSALVSTLELVNSRRRLPIHLRERDLCGDAPPERRFCHAAAGKSLAVDWDGKLYPCGQTMGDDRFGFGTLTNPEFPTSNPLANDRIHSTACPECDLRQGCPGECPSRLHYNCSARSQLACTLYRGASSRGERSPCI